MLEIESPSISPFPSPSLALNPSGAKAAAAGWARGLLNPLQPQNAVQMDNPSQIQGPIQFSAAGELAVHTRPLFPPDQDTPQVSLDSMQECLDEGFFQGSTVNRNKLASKPATIVQEQARHC